MVFIVMNFHERLKQKMDEKGLKPAQIARATKKSAVAAGKWVHGDSVPKAETLKLLADFLGVSDEWLLSGKEKPNNFNMQDFIKETEQHYDNVRPSEKVLRRVPLLDYVQAGMLNDVGYDGINPLSYSWTTYESARPECVFSLIVEGLSMAPDFMPGDELIVDGSLQAKPGSLVVAQEMQNGMAKTTFKKYRVIGVNEHGVDIVELVPLNNDFPTLNSLQVEISIIGVVVRHIRELSC